MPFSSVPSVASLSRPLSRPRWHRAAARKSSAAKVPPSSRSQLFFQCASASLVCGRLGDQHEILDQAVADRLRHDHQDVDVVGADDDHGIGEDLVGVGHRPAQRLPVVAVDFGKIIGTADRGALVRADRVGDGDAVGEEGGDGLRVQPLDVIAFEEGVDHQLPVGGDVVRPALGRDDGRRCRRRRNPRTACRSRRSPPARRARTRSGRRTHNP